MVVPVGYDTIWQRFENEVYQTVKKHLKNKFRVKWQYDIYGLKPDVVALLECSGCENKKDDFPCVTPAFIFDAYCKFKIERTHFNQKDEQMKKYSNFCDSILVMPEGYGHRPYCRSENSEYYIISFHYLPTMLDCIKQESIITLVEDSCGYTPYCNSENVYKQFELSIRSKVDRCPNCNSEVVPISLIYCSKYDEYYYPDFLDHEIIEHGIIVFTYAECSACGDLSMFGWNYDDCPNSSIEHKYQCKKCGAVFDPDTEKIIKDFKYAHKNLLEEEFNYYESIKKV